MKKLLLTGLVICLLSQSCTNSDNKPNKDVPAGTSNGQPATTMSADSSNGYGEKTGDSLHH